MRGAAHHRPGPLLGIALSTTLAMLLATTARADDTTRAVLTTSGATLALSSTGGLFALSALHRVPPPDPESRVTRYIQRNEACVRAGALLPNACTRDLAALLHISPDDTAQHTCLRRTLRARRAAPARALASALVHATRHDAPACASPDD